MDKCGIVMISLRLLLSKCTIVKAAKPKDLTVVRSHIAEVLHEVGLGTQAYGLEIIEQLCNHQ